MGSPALDPRDRGFQLSDAVFETIPIRAGRPVGAGQPGPVARALRSTLGALERWSPTPSDAISPTPVEDTRLTAARWRALGIHGAAGGRTQRCGGVGPLRHSSLAEATGSTQRPRGIAARSRRSWFEGERRLVRLLPRAA